MIILTTLELPRLSLITSGQGAFNFSNLKLLRNEYTHQSTGIKMRVQFVAAVILKLP